VSEQEQWETERLLFIYMCQAMADKLGGDVTVTPEELTAASRVDADWSPANGGFRIKLGKCSSDT